MLVGPGSRPADENGGSSKTPPEPVGQLFWTIVVLVNAGILAVSLGVMLVGFNEQYESGAVLIGAGTLVLADAYRRYRSRHEVFEGGA